MRVLRGFTVRTAGAGMYPPGVGGMRGRAEWAGWLHRCSGSAGSVVVCWLPVGGRRLAVGAGRSVAHRA